MLNVINWCTNVSLYLACPSGRDPNIQMELCQIQTIIEFGIHSSIHLSIHAGRLLSVHTFIHLSWQASIHRFIHPYIYLSILSFVHPSVRPSVIQSLVYSFSVCLSNYISIHLPVHRLSKGPSIHPSSFYLSIPLRPSIYPFIRLANNILNKNSWV